MSDPRHELPMHEAQHSFDVVLRGYDRSQVADTIERLEADFRIALADRDAAVDRTNDLAGQLSSMHAEIEALRRKAANASAPTFENISERIQHMLQLAEEEAGEIRRAAQLDAQAVREQTDAEERALLERHAAGQAEVERMIGEARQGSEQIMQKAQLRADELVAKAQERVARLDAESQARRAKVEEDFDIAQRARRVEAARLEEERERVSTQAARQRIAAAEHHAAQVVAEAEARAEAIRGVRDELTSRLVQARRLLDSLPDLGDRPEQPAAGATEQPVQAPGAEARRTEAPRTEAPRTETPSTETPSTEAPRAQGPRTGTFPAVVPPAEAPRTEAERVPAEQRPSPTPRPAQTTPAAEQTAPAAEQTAPAEPAPASGPPASRDDAEQAARQPSRAEGPVTRQLPLPPRPGTTPSGATAAPVGGPPTQSIDTPVGQGRS